MPPKKKRKSQTQSSATADEASNTSAAAAFSPAPPAVAHPAAVEGVERVDGVERVEGRYPAGWLAAYQALDLPSIKARRASKSVKAALQLKQRQPSTSAASQTEQIFDRSPTGRIAAAFKAVVRCDFIIKIMIFD